MTGASIRRIVDKIIRPHECGDDMEQVAGQAIRLRELLKERCSTEAELMSAAEIAGRIAGDRVERYIRFRYRHLSNWELATPKSGPDK